MSSNVTGVPGVPAVNAAQKTARASGSVRIGRVTTVSSSRSSCGSFHHRTSFSTSTCVCGCAPCWAILSSRANSTSGSYSPLTWASRAAVTEPPRPVMSVSQASASHGERCRRVCSSCDGLPAPSRARGHCRASTRARPARRISGGSARWVTSRSRSPSESTAPSVRPPSSTVVSGQPATAYRSRPRSRGGRATSGAQTYSSRDDGTRSPWSCGHGQRARQRGQVTVVERCERDLRGGDPEERREGEQRSHGRPAPGPASAR